MYLSPRHSEIIQMAKDNGRVLVDDLATHFAVTPQTIRKDLNDLCDQRLLTRIHGGALFPSGIENMEYEARRKIAADEKEAIIERLTDAMVSVEGESMRPVTWVTIEEVASGDWGIAGQALHTGDIVGMRAAAQ